MQKLPQFILSRLASQERVTAEHPDANVLLALTDGGLSARERSLVLAHLAQCPDCREVIALTSAADPHQSPTFAPEVRPRAALWKWRWTAAALVSCLIGTVIWQSGVFQKFQQDRAEALRSSARAKEAPFSTRVEPKPTQPRADVLTPQQGSAPKVSIQKQRVQTSKQKAIPIPKTPARETPREEQKPESLAAMAPRPLPRERQSVSNTVAGVAGNLPPPIMRQQLLQGFNSDRVSRPQVESVNLQRSDAGMPAKTLWNLSAATADVAGGGGILRKSEDGGKTWRSVRVGYQTHLYALAANGPDVWVGGAQGALFHSVDDGSEWKPVVVSDEETRLTDSIVGIELRDDNSLRITVKSGVHWESTDGGLHWRRQ